MIIINKMIYIIFVPLIFLVLDTYKKNYKHIDYKLQELDSSDYDENW